MNGHTHAQVLLCCDKNLDPSVVHAELLGELPRFAAAGGRGQEGVGVVHMVSRGHAESYHMLLRCVGMGEAMDTFKGAKNDAPVSCTPIVYVCSLYLHICVRMTVLE